MNEQLQQAHLSGQLSSAQSQAHFEAGEITHQPKGSMCMSCANSGTSCAALPFASMPVIKRYPDGVLAVKCSTHTSAPTETKTCLGCGARHPFNADGTPVGGSLPCGH